MAIKPDYMAGTITVAANGTVVTGVGSQWVSADIQPGDTLKVKNLDAVIATVTSNTSITLAEPWTGGALSASAYRIRYQPDGSRFTAALRDLVTAISTGSIAALQALTGAAGKIPYFTGPGAMALVDMPVSGQLGDVVGPTTVGFVGNVAVFDNVNGRKIKDGGKPVTITIETFGAKTTNTRAQNTTAINAAIAFAALNRIREINVPDGEFLSNALTNPNGVKLVGSGKVSIGTLAAYTKANSTADYYDPQFDGREYLQRVHKQLSGTNQTVVCLYGDSTVANVSVTDTEYYCENVLKRTAYQKGAFQFVPINRGVSGTYLGHLVADPSQLDADLANAAVNCIILKYMINDGGYAPAGDCVELFASNLDWVLSRIRAARGVDTLSVILVTGNTVNDPATGRDQQWFEKAIPVLRAGARKHKCAFVDVYSPFRDAVNAGSWMDDLSSNGVHIHPLNVMQGWIWGEVGKVLFDDYTMRRIGLTANTSYSSASGVTVTPATLPNVFPFGNTDYRAQASQGWPTDGSLFVRRTADGIVWQTLVAYGAGNIHANIMMRSADSVGNVWKRWSRETNTLTLVNGWVDYAGGWVEPRFSASADGYVQLEGRVKNGTTTGLTIIATLPVGYRPAAALDFVVPSGAGTGQLFISADGTIRILSGGDATYMSLNPIRFRAGN